MNDTLDALRTELDAVDAELARLLAQRMEIAQRVGLYKQARGLPVLDAAREEAVLRARAALVAPAWGEAAHTLFETLMRLSRQEQERVMAQAEARADTVAYQGVPGAYGHQAALRWAQKLAACPQGASPERGDAPDATGLLACASFEDAFEAVCDGRAAYAVLPLENSSSGGIADVYDLLGRYGCSIVGEVRVAVRHCLLGVRGASLDGVRAVTSHEQGFLQCRAFLKRHADWRQEPSLNTAVSAQQVAECGDLARAAIASRLAAQCYGLDVLAEDIQTESDNVTRFVAIAAHPLPQPEADRATLAFALHHERGALHRALAAFVALGMNLTCIVSRPIPDQTFTYRFYVDIEGRMTSAKLAVLIEALSAECADCRLLGCYRAAGREEDD